MSVFTGKIAFLGQNVCFHGENRVFGCPKSRKIALSPIKTKITRVVGCRELVESCRGHFEHFWGPPKCSKPPWKWVIWRKVLKTPMKVGLRSLPPFLTKNWGPKTRIMGVLSIWGSQKVTFVFLRTPKCSKPPWKWGRGSIFCQKKGVVENHDFLDPFFDFSGFTLKMSNSFFDSEKSRFFRHFWRFQEVTFFWSGFLTTFFSS